MKGPKAGTAVPSAGSSRPEALAKRGRLTATKNPPAERWHRLTSMFLERGNLGLSAGVADFRYARRQAMVDECLGAFVPVAEHDFSCRDSWFGGEQARKGQARPRRRVCVVDAN